MSDTPRTDSVERGFTSDLSQNPQHRLSNLARQLERELAEAIAQRDQLLTAAEKWFEAWNTAYGWDFDQAKEMEKLIIKLKGQNHE